MGHVVSATPLASHPKGNSYFWPLPMCWIDKDRATGSGGRGETLCRMLAKDVLHVDCFACPKQGSIENRVADNRV